MQLEPLVRSKLELNCFAINENESIQNTEIIKNQKLPLTTKTTFLCSKSSTPLFQEFNTILVEYD